MRAVLKAKAPPVPTLKGPTAASASLEDESQQPPPPGGFRNHGRSSSPPGAQFGAYATEPTLKNDPSQPHDTPRLAHSYPDVLNGNTSQPFRRAHEVEHDDSEESEPLVFSIDQGSPVARPTLDAVREGSREDEEGDGERDTPPKRNSPQWATQPSDAVTDKDDVTDKEEEHEIDDTEVSELHDSLPPDVVNVPTPPDTQGDQPADRPAAPNTPPSSRSALRPLTDHPTPVLPRSAGRNATQTYVSPTQLGQTAPKLPSKTPTKTNKSSTSFFSRKRARSPPPDSLDDDFTRGMTPQQRPHKVLETLFKPVDELPEPSQESATDSSQDSHAGPSRGQTRSHQPFTTPAKQTTPAHLRHAPSTQTDSPPVPKGSDTFVDDEPEGTALTRNRFANVAGSRPSSPALFSDIADELRNPSPARSDGGSDFSFKATQVNVAAFESQSPAPRSVLSTRGQPVTPSPARPTPAPRATSTIPKIPEHRRLQRRAHTSVSEGQQSAMVRAFERDRSPLPFESTYIDAETSSGSVRTGEAPKLETVESNDRAGEEGSGVPSNPFPPTPPKRPDHLLGLHEPSGESLVRLPPARYSPNKYGRRASKRRRRAVLSDDTPEDADDEDAASASSDSTPQDPQDQTYQDQPPETHSSPVPQDADPGSLPSPPVTSTKPTTKGKVRADAKTESKPAAAASTSTRAQRGKRKALSPSPDLSGSSSSSAPPDPEDFTYRPINKNKGKAKAKPAPRIGRQTKKPKIEEPTAVPSRAASRAPSVRAPSALPPDAMPPPTPVASMPDGPVRVLAYWKTGEYFAGTVVGRKKTGYSVKFDDGLAATVPVAKMRLLDLKAGEPVRNGSRSNEDLQVTTPFDGTGDTVHVIDSSSEPMTIHVRNLVVLPAVIDKRFNKRLLDPEVLEARFPLVAGRGSAASVAGKQPLHGKVFLITRGEGRMSDDTLKKRIIKNGGAVEDDWKALFKFRPDGHEFKSDTLTPFVLQLAAKGVMSAKTMAALASGIPILSARYIDDAIIDHDADWRSYLVPAGESRYLFPSEPKESKFLWASQVVDQAWGEESWSPATARSVRQPFKSKTILFVDPGSKFEDIKILAPFCLTALGATVRRAKTIPSNITPYDLVMIEDRDKGTVVTREHKASGKLVNIAWLKNCLPIGKLLSPALVPTGE